MSAYNPISIIVADSIEAVNQIHSARQLPPLVDWTAKRTELLGAVDTAVATDTATALAGAHKLNGYITTAKGVTLYAVVPQDLLMEQGALTGGGFPQKAVFITKEFWMAVGDNAVNLRDRASPQGVHVRLNEIPVAFDLSFKETDSTGLLVDVHSQKNGYICTLIDSDLEGMSMSRISVADHLTNELSTPSEYTVDPITAVTFKGPILSLPPETWVLRRHLSASLIHHLGYITNEAGAKAALAYLVEHGKGQ